MTDKEVSSLTSIEYWSLSALAVTCIMLVVINIGMDQKNRELRQQVGQRQLFIAQTVPIEKINKQIVNAIARTVMETGDSGLTQLLGDQGIQVRAASDPAAMQQ